MFRKGFVRDDGKIFWSYKSSKNKKKYQVWLTKEKFDQYESARITSYKRRIEKYKKNQEKLPIEQRNFKGKYNPETGLYFICLHASGTPKFGTLAELEAYKLKRREQQRIAYEKRKSKIPPPNVCLGDKHPSIPDLVVVEIKNHKVKYGPVEKLQKRRERIKLLSTIYRQKKGKEIVEKYKQIRHEKQKQRKENPHLKFSRGDVNPLTKWKFWTYSALGNEVWLPPEEFDKKRAAHNKKVIAAYHAKKQLARS